LATLLVAFPDGLAPRSRRDRLIGRSIIALMALITVVSAASNPVAADTASGQTVTYPNPLGVALVPKAASDWGFIPVILTIAGCVLWMWRRQRREEGEARRRYTLVLYSFSVLVVALLFGILLADTFGEAAWLPAYLAWFAVPVAFAVAVVRHGLYGVDRLVRRTVTYGLVGAIVATVYVVAVVSLPRLLGESNDLVIAASTLAAAVVFNRARRRIRSAVDHRFDRAKYDAVNEVDVFAERLKNSVALNGVVDDFSAVVHRTVAPSTAAVWLRPSRPDSSRSRSLERVENGGRNVAGTGSG
jgi:formate hydrogenlyase subunit 3/multisubunit Na+/H+ antiporter MnhD subunit